MGRCAAGEFSSDFYFDKAIMICRVRLRFSSYLLFLSVRYFLISPLNLLSAMTGEVLGSSLCRRASPPSEALWSQPQTAGWAALSRREPGPGAQGRGTAASPQPARLPLLEAAAAASLGIRASTLQLYLHAPGAARHTCHSQCAGPLIPGTLLGPSV